MVRSAPRKTDQPSGNFRTCTHPERSPSDLKDFKRILGAANQDGVRWHLTIDDRRGALALAPVRINCRKSFDVRHIMEVLTIQPFLDYFGTVRERTMRVARCIPPDKIEWTYAP